MHSTQVKQVSDKVSHTFSDKFSDLRLAEPILRAVAAEGYTTATPIQAQSIPHVLAGRDVLGCAQTGTGKTAAFALPILHRLAANPTPGSHKVRCLVLCPTRELATQIGDSFRAYGRNLGLRHTVVFGGVGQGPQVDTLRRGVDVLVATPGRLLDLMNQGCVDLRAVEVLVLDEADRMLDMGFIHDIRRIVAKLPVERQTLLFSATMPTEIRTLANTLLRNPATVQVAPVAATADRVEQSVYFVDRRNKPDLLAHVVNEMAMARAIVFTRTKHGADRVVRQLHARGIRAEAIHGNRSQNARQRALHNFKNDKTPVLVATDIASRGIDVEGISHVVNYDLTHEPETYVHRIGRTARAGASGAAVSFCDPEEVPNLRAIEKLIRQSIPVRTDHPTYPGRDAASRERPRGTSHSGVPQARFPKQPRSHSHASKPRHAATGQGGHRSHAPHAAHAAQTSRSPNHPQGGSANGNGRAAERIRHPLHGGMTGMSRRGGGRRRHASAWGRA